MEVCVATAPVVDVTVVRDVVADTVRVCVVDVVVNVASARGGFGLH